MKRRNFIQKALGAAMAQVTLGGLSFQVRATPSAWLTARAAAANDNILVIIQMSGGNDGLNMVPPLDQMSRYNTLRPTIKLAESAILPLGTTGAGLHPSMGALKTLYDEGRMAVVQGLGYPNQSFSHFTASKIWSIGTTDTQESTGWAGRYLNKEYPDFPAATYTDPIALQVQDISTTLFNSKDGLLSAAYNFDTLNNIITKPLGTGGSGSSGGNGSSTGACTYDNYLAYVQEQILLTDQFAGRIKTAGTLGQNAISNYPSTDLANKLKVIAKLIRGGLKTKIYHVTLGGFDTHVEQLGRHTALFTELSGAVSAFQRDLLAMGTGVSDKVTTMTFSEFGRRAQENASFGTDHGTAVPMLVFGTQLNPVNMVGKSPNLNNLTDNNLPNQFDYRQSYAAYLQDWLGVSKGESDFILLQGSGSAASSFAPLPIFRQSANPVDPCADTKCIPATVKITD